MSNFIVPPSLSLDEDTGFTSVVQETVAGITGIDPTLVRLRWTTVQPPIPTTEKNWCAIGATLSNFSVSPIINVAQDQDNIPTSYAAVSTDDLVASGATGVFGSIEQQNMRAWYQIVADIQLLASFYGPKANSYSGILRDGLNIESNRWLLQAAGIGVHTIGQIVNLPELTGNEYRTRSDLHLVFNRMIEREFIIGAIPSPKIISIVGP